MTLTLLLIKYTSPSPLFIWPNANSFRSLSFSKLCILFFLFRDTHRTQDVCRTVFLLTDRFWTTSSIVLQIHYFQYFLRLSHILTISRRPTRHAGMKCHVYDCNNLLFLHDVINIFTYFTYIYVCLFARARLCVSQLVNIFLERFKE